MNFHAHTDEEPELLVGLEIGTASIKTLVGATTHQTGLQIIGMHKTPSKGMDKGGVNDLSLVRDTLNAVVETVSNTAACDIGAVTLALSGKHIGCQNEIGLIPLEETDITEEDVAHVLHIAQSIKLKEQHRLLHVIPQHFCIDYQDSIKNPVGLSGMRMAANVHLITYHHDTAKNLLKAVKQCGLQVEHAVFSGLASSEAVLFDDEKELGVCVVDMGAGTMDLCIYVEGELKHSQVIPYAGNAVTNDIAYAFRTPIAEAERIKREYGSALKSLVSSTETVEISSIGGRDTRAVLKQQLAAVIEPRYTEFFRLLKTEINEAKWGWKKPGQQHPLAAGIVFTGGATEIEGFLECASQIFSCPVRKGVPHLTKIASHQPLTGEFSTTVGLLRYAAQQPQYVYQKPTVLRRLLHPIFRFKRWIGQEF